MTLAELQITIGAPQTGGVMHAELRGELAITAWPGSMDGADGWWVVVLSGVDSADVLTASWIAGAACKRDQEINSAVARVRRGKPC